MGKENLSVTRYLLVSVGVGIVFILGIVTVMITPFAYSYTEKVQEELDRLNEEYLNENEKVINPKDIIRKKIDTNEKELLSISENITLNSELLQEEQKIVESQQKKVNKSWDAAPVDRKNLYVIISKLSNLISQKEVISDSIETSKMLLDVMKFDAKIIGIQLSPVCEKLIKNNLPTNCPTYEDLEYLDSSNYLISGKFSFHDGWYHREKTEWQEPWKWYETNDKIRIIVDPDYPTGIRHKMITIENNLGMYPTIGDSKTDGITATIHHDRYIKECHYAHISAENYLEIIEDTIYTLRNGCNDSEFDEVITYYLPYTPMDRSMFTETAYQKWLKDAKERCKELC